MFFWTVARPLICLKIYTVFYIFPDLSNDSGKNIRKTPWSNPDEDDYYLVISAIVLDVILLFK